jgi:hypothetical protein
VITSPPYTNFTVAKCLTHIGTEGIAVASVLCLPLYYAFKSVRTRTHTKRLIHSVGLLYSFKNPHDQSAVWATIKDQIRTRPAGLHILCSTAYNILGKPNAPLHNALTKYTGEVRILLLDPDCDHFRNRAIALRIGIGQYTDEFNETITYCTDLKSTGVNISVYLYNSPPLWTIINISEWIWVKYYKIHQRSYEAPFFCFYANNSRSSLYYPFTKMFSAFWNDPNNKRRI